MVFEMRPAFYLVTLQTSTATVAMFQLIFIPPATSVLDSVAYPRVNTFTGSRSTVCKTACLTGLPGTPGSVKGLLYEKKNILISRFHFQSIVLQHYYMHDLSK